MCKKTKGLHNRIDPCLKDELKSLHRLGIKTIASCCGHKKYNKTIVMPIIYNGKKAGFEIFSATILLRTRKFYKRDKEGIYYIPEVSNEKI